MDSNNIVTMIASIMITDEVCSFYISCI